MGCCFVTGVDRSSYPSIHPDAEGQAATRCISIHVDVGVDVDVDV